MGAMGVSGKAFAPMGRSYNKTGAGAIMSA